MSVSKFVLVKTTSKPIMPYQSYEPSTGRASVWRPGRCQSTWDNATNILFGQSIRSDEIIRQAKKYRSSIRVIRHRSAISESITECFASCHLLLERCYRGYYEINQHLKCCIDGPRVNVINWLLSLEQQFHIYDYRPDWTLGKGQNTGVALVNFARTDDYIVIWRYDYWSKRGVVEI